MTSCIMNKLLIALIVVVIRFMVSETIVVTAQSNSNMDKQKMVVTWLETDNKTKTGGVPVISVSGDKF